MYLLKHLCCPFAGLRQQISSCTLRPSPGRSPACHLTLGFKVPQRDHGLNLEFKVPELDHGLNLQFKVLELLIFPLRFGEKDSFAAVIPPRTPKPWNRLRRRGRERPAVRKSPVADDATRPVPSGGTENIKGGPVVQPACVKKIRAPLAEFQTKKLVIVMLLVADELDPEMNLEEILLDTESVITPVAHLVMTVTTVLRLEIVMTPACQLVTTLTAGLIDHAPQEDDTKRRLIDPEARIATGPQRDQGPGAAATMAAPSGEGPAVLLAEESLWSAGPYYIGHLRHRLLAAVKAPGHTNRTNSPVIC